MSNANAHNGSAPAETADQEFLERLRAATDLLEHLASNWAVLNAIPGPERERMHRVIAQLYNPDPIARKKRTKAFQRERTATRVGRTEAVLDDTGIRTLRRKPVYTSPNVYPPPDFDQRQQEASVDPQHCYICKQKFST